MAQWTTDDILGLDTLKLPDGFRPLEVVAAVKCLTPDGHVAFCHRYSRTVSTPEALGMAHGLVITLSDAVADGFTSLDAEPHQDPDA